MLGQMPLSRRQLLYAMLGALAFAALSGVAALLTNGAEEVWRIAGTGLIVAVAALIMMPMSALAGNAATRLSGLFGMGVVVTELALAAMLIWGRILPPDLREFLGWATGIIGPCGLIAARLLAELAKPGQKWTAIVGAGGCGLAAGSWLIAAALESYGRPWSIGFPFAAGGWAFLFAGFISAAALVGLKEPDRRWWRWLGVAAACVGAAFAIYGAIQQSGGNPAWFVGPYAFGAFIAHAVICLRLNLTSGQRWVRIIANASALCTAIAITYSLAEQTPGSRALGEFNWDWRMSFAFGLVCSSATMALLVLSVLNHRPKVRLARTSAFRRVFLICPRCGKRLTLPLGGALCDECRLHIYVTVQTTRCARCDYDLTDLSAKVCPECGTPIPIGPTGPETVQQ
jgi:hypothetical protein